MGHGTESMLPTERTHLNYFVRMVSPGKSIIGDSYQHDIALDFLCRSDYLPLMLIHSLSFAVEDYS